MLDSIYLSTDPQILGQRLQAARKSRNLTQQEVAARIGIARTTLVSLEKGERLPKEEELVQLAKLYDRQVHELLRQQTPAEDIIVQFRASRRLGGKLDKQLEEKIKDFQDLCEDYRELEHLRNQRMPSPSRRMSPPQAPVYTIDEGLPERSGEDVAAAERNRLGLGDAPIVSLRELLEKQGMRIFLIALPSHIGGFFGTNQALGPCIALNVQHPSERRQWTLAHEYAHFLTKRHEVDLITVYYAYQQVPQHERFANAFACAFLMPATSVSRQFHEMKESQGRFLPADLCLIASYFRVSIEAMARRLEDLQLIRPGKYQAMLANGFRPNEAREYLGLVGDMLEENALPLRYRYLALEALDYGDITENEFAHFLRTDIVQARHILKALRTRPATTPAGEIGQVEFSLADNMGA